MNESIETYYWKWIYQADKECPTLEAFEEWLKGLA
jgi:hypothetical protein